MATYQKWDQSYTPKVTTIKLTYRGVKYNKMCASSQSVHFFTNCPWSGVLLKSGRDSTGFLFQLFMSTLANQDIFETLYEEALEEIGISKDSLFYDNACKIAEEMAMNKFLSNNP